MIETEIPVVEEIFEGLSAVDGIEGYKNHVYRVVNFCTSLATLDSEERRKVEIAACFHDLGLFTDSTFDYIPPSIELARSYLVKKDLVAWTGEIESMIAQHHCLRTIREGHLAELFRKADLVDFSLGVFKFSIDGSDVRKIKSEFPNLGFHKGLAITAAKWIVRHPLNPAPVVKW